MFRTLQRCFQLFHYFTTQENLCRFHKYLSAFQIRHIVQLLTNICFQKSCHCYFHASSFPWTSKESSMLVQQNAPHHCRMCPPKYIQHRINWSCDIRPKVLRQCYAFVSGCTPSFSDRSASNCTHIHIITINAQHTTQHDRKVWPVLAESWLPCDIVHMAKHLISCYISFQNVNNIRSSRDVLQKSYFPVYGVYPRISDVGKHVGLYFENSCSSKPRLLSIHYIFSLAACST